MARARQPITQILYVRSPIVDPDVPCATANGVNILIRPARLAPGGSCLEKSAKN